MKNEIWHVKDFKRVDRPWGRFRKLVSKIEFADGEFFIGLFRENDDGRESICVHKTSNGHCLVKLPFYWVNGDDEKQKALDGIFEAIINSSSQAKA